ncbi:anti-sigma factor domain-containing protein [Agromyces sp. NPDC058484]|uniref:anti-sigma factor n=1 Tax=Agromyces sp. NPDC058484 TaxID=3346524 RepID=UPI00365B9054
MTGPNDQDDRERDERRGRHDDLAAYALDAVDAEERAAVERALAASAELRDEAEAYAETAAQLAGLAPPVAPPAELRARLMAVLDTTPQLATDASPATTTDASPATDAAAGAADAAGADATAVAPAAPAPAAAAPGRAETEARRRWFQRPGAIIAAAAAAVVLIAGAVIGIGWPGPNGWGAQQERAAIAAAPDAETTTLEALGGGEVTLVASASRGRSVVVAEGLPDVGSEQTYELWYIDDAGAAPAGTFDTTGGETWRVLDGSFTPGVAVGVTVEPAGGSLQPTTEPIVLIAT